MVGLMYRNVCTICDAVNVDSVERDICAACTPSSFVNVCTLCDATTVDSVPRKICAPCDSSAKKNLKASPQEKKSSATPSLKLFKIVVYRTNTGILVRTSIVLDIDRHKALTYERLAPKERQEVTEIKGPFQAGYVIHCHQG